MITKSKIKDIYNIKEKEVQYALVLSIIMMILLYFLNIYDDFITIQDKIINILELLLGEVIGLLGFSISAIAIIVTLFSKEEMVQIEKINRKKILEDFLSSYVFLNISIAVEVVEFVIVVFTMTSNASQINATLFWIISWILIYHFFFNIFYLVALVRNCVELYKIKRIYGEIQREEWRFVDEINDVRIEFLLSSLMNVCNCSQQEMKEFMIEFVKNRPSENRERLEKYIEKRYGQNEKKD